ncbi:tRNA wybutosine-synthesizing protein 2 [Cytospora mali]|uniref:tRNA wybutosine-synthesizing protein 2 n=1 Tax=Cytospora mali TaxID=578113 RepID=A0A194V3U9_CYTMA|nr:tRNA wybutosine-synthesizing protein 2 [Valsa mali var. pyri (nom. inval.)]
MPRHKLKAENPISSSVTEWFNHNLSKLSALEAASDFLVAEAPKRWVVYEPMVLLPSGSFASPAWRETLAAVSQDCRDGLWSTILRRIGETTREKTSHLAVNDGIPLTVAAHSDTQNLSGEEEENILRSPIGLRILHGDFGPPGTKNRTVSDEDFVEALWVSTKQNGIHQTWAPRWTMFSRGNVKEKARLLTFHEPPKSPQQDEAQSQLSHRARPRAALRKTWAVDLYGGIGYFVFSYAKLGMRVLCWELNPWSVEGLRRGARANGWSVKVIKDEDLMRPTPELVSEEDKIVVFLENNQEAVRRVRELRGHGLDLQVSHVNCGLLPRSADSWEASREILGEDGDGWLHLHENVGVEDIEPRKGEIQNLFDKWNKRGGGGRSAKVEHAELVKTFAPDVWHCVFDVYITKSNCNATP